MVNNYVTMVHKLLYPILKLVSWARTMGGIACGSGGHGVGEINGVKGRTTINEQQEQKI